MLKHHWTLVPAAALTMLLAGCEQPEAAAGAGPNAAVPAGASDDLLVDAVRARLRRDAEMTARVKTALLDDATLGQFDINVITLGGKMRLIGVVGDQAQIDRAIRVARSVEGVSSVNADLSVRR